MLSAHAGLLEIWDQEVDVRQWAWMLTSIKFRELVVDGFEADLARTPTVVTIDHSIPTTLSRVNTLVLISPLGWRNSEIYSLFRHIRLPNLISLNFKLETTVLHNEAIPQPLETFLQGICLRLQHMTLNLLARNFTCLSSNRRVRSGDSAVHLIQNDVGDVLTKTFS